MRRSLVVLLAVLGLGCLTGAVQALGIVSAIPLLGDGSSGRAAAAAGRDGVAVRDGRVAVNTTADRPDVDAGDGRCAGPRGFCTLRAAVMEANANDDLVRVTLQRRTYRLRVRGGGEDAGRRGDLDVRGSLAIVGRGARILGGKRDRVFDVAADARLEVVGARIAGGAPPEGESGGAIRTAGRLSLTRVRVVKSAVTGPGADGGGIANDGGSVLLRASQVNRNEASGSGGAIAADGGTILLRGTRLLVNRAGVGGGIHVAADGTADVRDTSIERNHAAARGGGLHVSGATVRVAGGSVSDNEADDAIGAGGGIFNDRGQVVVDGADVRRNAARGAGGGVAAVAGTTTLAHVQLRENAGGAGGGLHLAGGGRVQIDSSVLQDNRAASSGGALWADAGTVTITGPTYLVVNTAAGAGAQEGGGAIFNGGARIEIDGGPIAGNRAPGAGAAGGGILNRAGTLVVRDGDISRNAAGRAGGGIALVAGSVETDGCAIDGNTAARGAGVHVGPGSFASHADRISGNRAGERGGGLWKDAEGTIRLMRTNVVGNDAPDDAQLHTAGAAASFTLDGGPAAA